MEIMSTVQSGPEKNAQSLMHHYSATVHCRITRFASKCSMQNACQSIKYPLVNCRKWIHVINDINLQSTIRNY